MRGLVQYLCQEYIDLSSSFLFKAATNSAGAFTDGDPSSFAASSSIGMVDRWVLTFFFSFCFCFLNTEASATGVWLVKLILFQLFTGLLIGLLLLL